jgi:CO/xanthine dehydrogenase FAD-binding subunit
VYVRPRTIADATAALANCEKPLLVNGGTDLFPAHAGRPFASPVVDISAVAGLRGIAASADVIRIGAGTTWSEILRAPLPPAFDGLKAAAGEVGSVQIQNRGTIGGNLCNASPAADGVPPLLTLDALVEIASRHGTRQLPLADFITGYRQTALQPGEILTSVIVPTPSGAACSSFVKLGARRYLVISILMAAAMVERGSSGRIALARVAVGAASPVACRLAQLERDLTGLPEGMAPSSILSPDHLASLDPIDDVRATASYRRDAALAIVGEALDRAAGVF